MFEGKEAVARCTICAPWEYPDRIRGVRGQVERVVVICAALFGVLFLFCGGGNGMEGGGYTS